MHKPLIFSFLISLICSSCTLGPQAKEEFVSLHIVDQNGFSENIANKDRLKDYQKVDFFLPQPFLKIHKVFKKPNKTDLQGILISYYPSGSVKETLETLNNKACGRFTSWYENGQRKVEAYIIGGSADLDEQSRTTWLFDGQCLVYFPEGKILAKLNYQKGLREGESFYYHKNQVIKQKVQYKNGQRHGLLQEFNNQSRLIKQRSYKEGFLHGLSYELYQDSDLFLYKENYNKGRIDEGQYSLPKKQRCQIEKGTGKQAVYKNGLLFQIKEYQKGVPTGKVEEFFPSGRLKNCYSINEGEKNGPEFFYYDNKNQQRKTLLPWKFGKISGLAQSWFSNGNIESQKEMLNNQRHGKTLCWYINGNLMLSEEYEKDKLLNGEYFKKGQKTPFSRVVNGWGHVSLFDSDGQVLEKIKYENGQAT